VLAGLAVSGNRTQAALVRFPRLTANLAKCSRFASFPEFLADSSDK
jgi:hypothetical protein